MKLVIHKFISRIHYDVIEWKHFHVTVPLCGEFTGKFPSQWPVMRSFDIFFHLRLNKLLSKQCEAGDLRRHRVHYVVTVMRCHKHILWNRPHVNESRHQWWWIDNVYGDNFVASGRTSVNQVLWCHMGSTSNNELTRKGIQLICLCFCMCEKVLCEN